MAIFKRPRPQRFHQGSVAKRVEGKSVRLALTTEEFALLGELTNGSGLRDRARFLRWLVAVWAEVQKEAGRPGAAVYDSDDPAPQLGFVHRNTATGKLSFRAVKLPDGWDRG